MVSLWTEIRAMKRETKGFVLLPIARRLTFCCRHSLHALLTGCFLLSSWFPSSDPSASGDSTVPGELSNPASEAFLLRFDIPLAACLSLTGLPKPLLPPTPAPLPLPTPAGSATMAGVMMSNWTLVCADVNRPQFGRLVNGGATDAWGWPPIPLNCENGEWG